MYDSTKDNLQYLKLGILMLFVGLFIGGHLMSTPRYLDRTDRKQWDLEDKAFLQMVTACRQVGGVWSAGFASAGCSIAYPKPDLSWYTPPIDNPWYYPLDTLGVVFALGAFIGALLVLCTVSALLLDAWESRPKRHVRWFKKPFVL